MAHSAPLLRRLAPVVAALTVTSLVVLQAGQAPQTNSPDDDGRIRHVLNRLTFGPRPGDVERVRQLGIDGFIDQQLFPERIDDSAVEARLESFETLTLSSAELAERYFEPADRLRRQQQAAAGRAAGAAGAATPADSGAAVAGRAGRGGRGRAGQTGAGAPTTGADPNMGADSQMTAPAVRAAAPSAEVQAAQMRARQVTTELMHARIIRAVDSERQLQEVLTDFWFNHFSVFIGKGVVRNYLTEYERDAIRPHVLGSFRELLGAVAKSPAMLFYLDNWQSSAPGERPELTELERRLNDSRLSPAARQRLMSRLQQMRPAQQARGLNENYARELLELHTLGVDGGYTQNDVVALARILTGWTIEQPRQGGGFLFRAATHDTGTKVLLGKTFGPAGQSEGEFALDLLAAHPATARHIATKLAQRFVADEPSTAVVDRAARVFTETRGDLRAVVRAIVTSPEFFAADVRRAKVKTPIEFVVSAVRATGATVIDAQPLVGALQTLGMPLYGSQPPTGYGIAASDWVNTGALLARMNFALDLVEGGRNMRPAGNNGPNAARQAPANAARQAARNGRRPAPLHIDIGRLAQSTEDDAQRVVVDALLGGVVSDATRGTLSRAESPVQLVALTLGSPEFQRR